MRSHPVENRLARLVAPLAGLAIHFGAGLDVIGFHAEDVSAATRRAIVEAWPRHAMKEAFAQRLEAEVAHKPGCHFRGHARLGFAMKVRQAPFAE